MKTTQILRDQLGLSQEIMAQYLSISQSLLALYEKGRRDLPTDAVVKMAEIFLFTTQKEAQLDLPFQKQQELKTVEVLHEQTAALEYKEMKAQRTLDKIKKKYDQSLKLHALAQHLQTSNKVQSTLFLQLATIGLEKYGMVAQTKEIIKLEGIKSQLQHITLLKKM
jgi:transcriptional regulator with XRE-family HTH domain